MELLINGLISVVTMIVGYLIGKKRQDADIKVVESQAHTSELDATEKAVKIWRDLAEDMKKEVDQLRILVDQLRKENEKLRQEVDLLQEKLAKVM